LTSLYSDIHFRTVVRKTNICAFLTLALETEGAVKKTHVWLFPVAVAMMLGGSHAAFSQNAAPDGAQIQGLPASDVLGSEDLWDNPTFVGGVIDGGPSASSEY
jgi:hypothetical protein